VTDDPVEFLLLLPMKMMMVMMMMISTKKMDDNDSEVDNNYDIHIIYFRPHKSKIPEESQMFQPRWKKHLNFAGYRWVREI